MQKKKKNSPINAINSYNLLMEIKEKMTFDD